MSDFRETDPSHGLPSPVTAPGAGVQPELVRFDKLKHRLEEIITAGRPCAILHGDLDDLKSANDPPFGDAGGDELIRRTFQTLVSNLRYTTQQPETERRKGSSQFEHQIFQIIDTRSVARLHDKAGDDFVILLEGNITPELLKAIKERIQGALLACRTTPPLDVAPDGIRASIGGKICEDGDTAESMLAAANQDMQVDKAGHKDDDLLELTDEQLLADIVRVAGSALRARERNPRIKVDPRRLGALIGAAMGMYQQGGSAEIRRRRRAHLRARQQNGR